MATNFPTSLDSLTNPTATDTLDSPPHDTQHADANDAIEAIQAKVGIDSSAVTTSLDYKVGALESRPVETKTVSYTLVATDVNKRIVMNSASATTITVNDGVFAAGDTVWIHNIGAGTTTVTAGTATVNTAGSLDVGQWEGGSLYFTSASSAIFFRGGGAGVANANFTDTATGTYSSGGKNYKYLTFTASGTLTVDTAGLADILVVGGGGGGGAVYGGGGGAGGMLTTSIAYFDATTYTVTIGAGGAGGIVSGTFEQPGQNGNGSRLGDYYALGGGGGGSDDVGGARRAYGLNGGSGGGCGGRNTSSPPGGAGVTGQGNDGGDGALIREGGGGGGAGAAGASAATGNGGAGLQSSLDNVATYYAGGGGGYNTSGGSGGTGGGGAAASGSSAGSGTANTGGGGGGGDNNSGNYGAAGGSGIVIVRVEV